MLGSIVASKTGQPSPWISGLSVSLLSDLPRLRYDTRVDMPPQVFFEVLKLCTPPHGRGTNREGVERGFVCVEAGYLPLTEASQQFGDGYADDAY